MPAQAGIQSPPVIAYRAQRKLPDRPVKPGDDKGTGLVVEEAAELAAAAWVLELAQRLGFDLADALAGHR